jgi:hypothetical protein
MTSMNNRIGWHGRLRQIATIVGVVAVAGATLAAVHEEGVLKPATRSLTAGDSLDLKGEKFTKNSSLTLQLVGVGGELTLLEVRTDSTGAFSTRVFIPAEAAAGGYRLVAIAADDDEVASLDVTVAMADMAADRDEMAGHDEMEMMDEPSAEPLVLDRARSGPLTWGVGGGIVVALAMSVMIFRRKDPVDG